MSYIFQARNNIQKLHTQQMTLTTNDTILLDDSKTLEYYGVINGAHIRVNDSLKLDLTVNTLDERRIKLQVRETDTIIGVAKKLKDKIPFHKSDHGFLFKNNFLECNNDKIVEYGVQDGSILDVVDLKTESQESLDSKATKLSQAFTIGECRSNENADIGNCMSEVRSTKSMDDSFFRRSVEEKVERTTRAMSMSRITIWIFPHDMESFPLEVCTTDLVIDVKNKIYAKILLPVKDQQLQFMATSLTNNRPIAQVGIIDKGEVVLRRKRGICLIISNEIFVEESTLPKRQGTKLDENTIRQTFEEMGYEIIVHQDAWHHQIEDIIKTTKDRVNSDHNMLIVFVMSHGTENAFYTSDDILLPFKNVWTPFSNVNFQTFAGKHKIFFFVCCRGANANKYIAVDNGSTGTASGNGDNIVADGPGHIVEYGAGVNRCPSRGNMFFGFSTVKDFISMRVPSEGTTYVQCLCKVIKKYRDCSLSDIHQEVQKILSQKYYIHPQEGPFVQMPSCTNELTEHAYF